MANFVILNRKEEEEDGKSVYDIRGLLVEILRLTMKKLNTTVVYLQPSMNLSFAAAMKEASRLTPGISDVVVGMVPLLPIAITGMAEPSISFDSSDYKWFLPCPKPISRVDRFLTVFDASVWLTMTIVFV